MQQLGRQPRGPPAAEVPSEAEQAAHRLTHVPFASWCPSCIAHRSRPDRHERTGESHANAVPTISFDFFYTKADGEAPGEDAPDTILALIMVCSQTSYVACVPLQGKSQLDLINRELVQFAQRLGHGEVIFRCDNEPAILQLQRLATKTRQAMGLKTRMTSSVAYDHGNALAENAISRVRSLACSLMHHLHGRLGIQLSTTSALWSWALRHAAFLVSRFSVINGATPYELAYGRQFTGTLCEYGEPVFAFIHPGTKATPKWRRALFLGKSEDQNSFVLFDGQAVVLSKNVRRIQTTWRSHMAYYFHCKCYSWQYKSGFGARVLPTMKKAVPKAISFEVPIGPVEGSKLHDEEAEAVIKYAEQEKRAEEEQFAMGQHDPLALQFQQQQEQQQVVNPTVFDDHIPIDTSTAQVIGEAGGASAAPSSVADPGLMIPVTPPRDYVELESPRLPASTRPNEGDENESTKRARVEDAKKQRINRLRQEYEDRLSAVKIEYKEYFTMDDYSTDLDVENGLEEEQDDWIGEDEIQLTGIPEQLWADFPVESTPTEPPAAWIDELADQTEVKRLVEMGVLVVANQFDGAVTGSLSTKFVRDWRLKDYVDSNGGVVKRWMRRSRYVAREFANVRRWDTFSPATGAHTSNLLPLKYLWQKQLAAEMSEGKAYEVVLGCLDVKDAFLQVAQQEPILVTIHGEEYVIQRNLPGQRLGARAWYECLRDFLSKELEFEFCNEQPCLARNKSCTIIIHVDDIMFVGSKTYWQDVFLKRMSEKFSISHSQLDGVGTSVSFLRRKVTDMGDWLMLTPGISISKVVKVFEESFGVARAQKIPCSAEIQMEDVSQKLNPRDATAYRSIVGLCLYIGRERPDLMFTIKELAGGMSSPTLTGLQRLRKLVGYMKHVGDVGVKLVTPLPGQGKFSNDGEHFWVLETYSDADWSANRSHRRSTSCGMHFLNNSFLYGSSRTQKTISLSSCESELHSLVSSMCDGLFIIACAQFVLGESIHHVQFTDSSSARQLASRQGVGKVRHLSGKVLWVQQMVNDKLVILRQLPTAVNLADIGTKSLAKQRLSYLMNESGLIYVATGEEVGWEEAQQQKEKSANSQQIKRIAKTIFNMSVAMGLGPVVADAQQCSEPSSSTNAWWMLGIFLVLFLAAICRFGWRKWMQMRKDMENVETQLADHYEYAAWLCERLDNMTWMRDAIHAMGERLDQLANRISTNADDTRDALTVLDDATDVVRYGLMEFGGFVRNQSLTGQQRTHMFTQERANFVLWNMQRNRPDDTDSLEDAEEERLTDDEVEPSSTEGMSNLMGAMRREQNIALTREAWEDASMIQQALITILDASSGTNPVGMTMGVIERIRSIFQRLHRVARNRGHNDRAGSYLRYVEDLHGIMRG